MPRSPAGTGLCRPQRILGQERDLSEEEAETETLEAELPGVRGGAGGRGTDAGPPRAGAQRGQPQVKVAQCPLFKIFEKGSLSH